MVQQVSQVGEMIAWGVFDKDGQLVKWNCLSDGEEGLEIHRTRRLAKGACFADEHVEKLLIQVEEKRKVRK